MHKNLQTARPDPAHHSSTEMRPGSRDAPAASRPARRSPVAQACVAAAGDVARGLSDAHAELRAATAKVELWQDRFRLAVASLD